jgi:tetratricopeptide (TPR) repeat protein
MKRTAAVVGLLGLAAVWAVVAYQGAATLERDYRALLRNGDTALLEDQTFEAIEAYTNAIYLRPDSMLAHLRRGETYQHRGDLEAAAHDFQSAADLDPAATRPLEELADVRFRQERFARAAQIYEQRLRLDDRSPGVARKLAVTRYRDGNIDGAMAALDQVAKLTERLPDDYYLLGMCLREKRQLRDAAAAFEKAVARSPGLIPPREELADLYALLDRRSDELEQLQVLAGLDHQRAERQVPLALAHARAGRVELAVETLRNALDRASDHSQMYGAIGRVWLEGSQARNDRADFGKAIVALERVASIAGATSDIMTLYGRALAMDNQWDAAERVLLQATQRFPVEPSAFLEYAALAERHGHFEAARTALVDYGALVWDDRDQASRARRIGTLSLRLNEPKTALLWLQRAEAQAPGDTAALAALADAQLRSGDRDAARATALSGLEKDPTSVALRNVELRTRK